jgi:hypothetical protein
VTFLSSLTCFLLFTVSITPASLRSAPSPGRLDNVVLIVEHRL